ncbi:Pao retrotransposon peptidase [Ostertagia ostertagi]
MHTGGSFVNKIQDILTNSRWCNILITADIQAAFTQIRIAAEHRDLLRFLWLKDPNQAPSPSNMILDNIYVDNVFLAANTEEDALEKIENSRKLFRNIGMNLRDFTSNSEYVNKHIPDVVKGKTGNTKLLGVAYNTESDELLLDVRLSQKQQMTKRELVSAVHKIYDPLGLALPLTLKAKLLMREVVMLKIAWGKPLSTEYINRWNEICTEISGTSIRVPRNIGLTLHDGKGSTLWVFGDASQLAISCCSYVTHPPSNQTKGLLCAKTRLAPKERQLTIPRLELLAILISLRLAKTILRSYQGRITKVYIVNDSKIALAWTQTSRRLPLFVANQVDRIKKLHHSIQELGISLQLSYIESENNPADIATGLDQISAATTCAPTVKAPPQRTHAIIDTSRFRYYSRALCTLARAMKALSCWIARVNARNNRTIALPLLQRFLPDNEITSSELKAAEQLILHEQISDIDINELRSRYKDKNLFLDENGLIRANSRLTNAALPRDTKEPIFIPKESDLIRLIVNELHETNMHLRSQIYYHRALSIDSHPSSPSRNSEILVNARMPRISLPLSIPEMAPTKRPRGQIKASSNMLAATT